MMNKNREREQPTARRLSVRATPLLLTDTNWEAEGEGIGKKKGSLGNSLKMTAT